MPKPTDYVWIRRWGQLMGSYGYYITEQQRQAAADDAPVTAIFREHGETGTESWHTVEGVTSLSTLSRLVQYCGDDQGAKNLLNAIYEKQAS